MKTRAIRVKHFHLFKVWVSGDKTAIYWMFPELHEQLRCYNCIPVINFNPIKNMKTQNLLTIYFPTLKLLMVTQCSRPTFKTVVHLLK